MVEARNFLFEESQDIPLLVEVGEVADADVESMFRVLLE